MPGSTWERTGGRLKGAEVSILTRIGTVVPLLAYFYSLFWKNNYMRSCGITIFYFFTEHTNLWAYILSITWLQITMRMFLNCTAQTDCTKSAWCTADLDVPTTTLFRQVNLCFCMSAMSCLSSLEWLHLQYALQMHRYGQHWLWCL